MKKIFLTLYDKIKKHFVIVLGTLGIFLIVLAVVIASFFMKEDLEQFTIEEEDVYIYFQDMRFDYTTKITLDHEEGITKLLLDDQEVTLDKEPIYYSNKRQVIFPNDMSVVLPLSSGIQKKINYYTILDGTTMDYYVKNRNLNYKLSSAFFYDGDNLYFFIDDTDITFDDMTITIPAFSYVDADYNQVLYVYNYEEDYMQKFENITSDIMATNDNYTINLSIDSLILNDKTKLLMKNFDYLNNLE